MKELSLTKKMSIEEITNLMGDDISWISGVIAAAWAYDINVIRKYILPNIKRESVINWLALLSEREVHCILYRYRDGMTYDEIGQIIHRCRETARHIVGDKHPGKISKLRAPNSKSFRVLFDGYSNGPCSTLYSGYRPFAYTWMQLICRFRHHESCMKKDCSDLVGKGEKLIAKSLYEVFTTYDLRDDASAFILFRRICASFGMYDKYGPYDMYRGRPYYATVADELFNSDVINDSCLRINSQLEKEFLRQHSAHIRHKLYRIR